MLSENQRKKNPGLFFHSEKCYTFYAKFTKSIELIWWTIQVNEEIKIIISKAKCFHALLFYLDPRSDGLPLIQSPLTVFGIIAAYLYIVLSLGPKWMQNRAPFQIKNLLIVYNAFQIVANIYVWFYVRILQTVKFN